MSLVLDDVLISSNPATGAEVGRIPCTPEGQVAKLVAQRERRSTTGASARGQRDARCSCGGGRFLAATSARRTELIRDEIGKPGVEALAGDVVPTLDALRWTIKHAGRALRDVRVGAEWQRWLLMPGCVCAGAPWASWA